MNEIAHVGKHTILINAIIHLTYYPIFALQFSSMNIRRFFVFYRLSIAIVLLGLGFLLGFKVTWWIAWIPFLIALIMVVAHFLIGPMTLIQGYIEDGDMEGAQKLLSRI